MTETLYINSATGLKDRIDRLDFIIQALELQVVNVGAGNSDVKSYTLDDGQTKISSEYQSMDSLVKAIEGFERLKERCLNQLNGRTMLLRDWSGLR